MDLLRGREPSAVTPPPRTATASPDDLSGRLRRRRKRKSGTTLRVVTVCMHYYLYYLPTCRVIRVEHPPTHLPCKAFVRGQNQSERIAQRRNLSLTTTTTTTFRRRARIAKKKKIRLSSALCPPQLSPFVIVAVVVAEP